MANRDSCIFYRSFYEAITNLPKENQLNLFVAIFELSLNRTEIELEGIEKTIFMLIRPQIEANIKRFNNGNTDKKHSQKEPKPKQNRSKTEAKPKQNESKSEANNNNNNNNNNNEGVVITSINNNNKNNNKELAVKKTTALNSQQEVYNIFAEKYLAMSKQVYKSDKKDFICLADLIKKTSKEQVIQKIEIFEKACKISAVSEKPIWWCVKDGLSAFTIGNFVKNYNLIIPFLTDKEKEERRWEIEDEKRRQKFEAEQLKKQEGANVH